MMAKRAPPIMHALLLLSYLFSLASALAPHERAAPSLVRRSTGLLPPSEDPFYTAPAGYETAAPGAVLRVRGARGNLTQISAGIASAYNILYRTTDSNYKPAWAVTTLYLPKSASNSTYSVANKTTSAPGPPLLSYLVAYDSANVDSSPSYTFYGGNPDPNVDFALSQGWYLNVPDYEGPLASFTSGVQSGHATIDSVRAVLNSGFGLAPDAKYALYGYSGGALAGEWAAELQAQYAPELHFAGAALGGLTPNITSVVESVSGTKFAQLVVNGVLGLTSQDADARGYLEGQLRPDGPYNATAFLAARTQSTADDAVAYAGQDIFAYFADGEGVLRAPALLARINRDGIMGYHGVPQMPVFAYKAVADEISKVADTDALVERYCGIGANILYQRNAVGGHTADAFNGAPEVIRFLSAVFDGSYASKYNATGCTIQNVTVAITTSPD